MDNWMLHETDRSPITPTNSLGSFHWDHPRTDPVAGRPRQEVGALKPGLGPLGRTLAADRVVCGWADGFGRLGFEGKEWCPLS